MNLESWTGDKNRPVTAGNRFPFQQTALAPGESLVCDQRHLGTVLGGKSSQQARGGNRRNRRIIIALGRWSAFIKHQNIRHGLRMRVWRWKRDSKKAQKKHDSMFATNRGR